MRRAVSLAALLVVLGCVAACDRAGATALPETASVWVTVDVDGDPRGIPVRDDDGVIGRTDQHGELRVDVRVGRIHVFTPECPRGREATPATLSLESRDEVTRVTLHCRTARRVAVVAVSASGLADVPVLVDGVEATRTAENGTAIVRLERPEGRPFEVTVDASGRSVEPARVSRAFRLEESDDLFVFACDLDPKRRPRRFRPRKTEVEERPYKLR